MKKHFLFNLEWDEILSELPKEVKYEVYDAIIEYAKSGKLMDLKPIAKGCFLFIKKEIDYYISSYDSKIEKRKEAGSKGGKAKQKVAKQANATFAKQNKQSQANGSINKNINENENINVLLPPNPQGGVADVAGAKEKILENFFSKQIALEQFCMSERTSPEELRRLADAVFAEWELVNERDVSEKHLINALRIKIRISHETDRPLKVDRLSERRGTPPDVSGQEDYSDTL